MNPVWDFLVTTVKHRPEPRYLPLAALYVVKLSFFEPWRLLEAARGQRGPYEPLPHPPLFVLGYYRSGTTHLQELLLEDPQLAYMNFYQGFFPTAFTSSDRIVRPTFEKIVRAVRMKHPAHGVPFSFQLPAEDDVALVASGSRLAANWGQVFPRQFQEIYGRYALMEGIDPDESEELGRHLHGLLSRVNRAAGGRRLLLKSPPHTGRLGWLRARYPEAQFVFIHRDPFDVFASNKGLWRSFEDQHLQRTTPEMVREAILWSYDRTHHNYVRDREGLRPDQLVEVSFDELQRDPVGLLCRVDEQLGLGRARVMRDAWRRYVDRNARPPLDHTLDDDERAAVRTRWARWFETFGYDASDQPLASRGGGR